MSLKICSLVFSVTENMLFSLSKSSTNRLPLQNAMRVQVVFLEKLQERSAGTYLMDTVLNAKRVAVWNYQFLVRGNSCRKIFGSWWLVVVVVINVLARGGLWWLVCFFRNDRNWRTKSYIILGGPNIMLLFYGLKFHVCYF